MAVKHPPSLSLSPSVHTCRYSAMHPDERPTAPPPAGSLLPRSLVHVMRELARWRPRHRRGMTQNNRRRGNRTSNDETPFFQDDLAFRSQFSPPNSPVGHPPGV